MSSLAPKIFFMMGFRRKFVFSIRNWLLYSSLIVEKGFQGSLVVSLVGCLSVHNMSRPEQIMSRPEQVENPLFPMMVLYNFCYFGSNKLYSTSGELNNS